MTMVLNYLWIYKTVLYRKENQEWHGSRYIKNKEIF